LILILIVAFLPDPSVAFAVILTVPFLPLTVFTLPFLSTVASLVLLDDHTTVLFALPFLVETFAFNFVVLPDLTVVFPESLILFTEPFMQVSVIFANFLLPSLAVAVIVTFLPPAFFLNVTRPFALTVATFLLLEVHVTDLSVALEGAMEALSFTFLPAAMRREGAAVSLMSVTL